VTTDSNTNAAEKPMSIRECLDAVHKAGGDAWDKVADPDGFIRWMRGSDDPKDVAAAEQAMQSMPAKSPASAPEQAQPEPLDGSTYVIPDCARTELLRRIVSNEHTNGQLGRWVRDNASMLLAALSPRPSGVREQPAEQFEKGNCVPVQPHLFWWTCRMCGTATAGEGPPTSHVCSNPNGKPYQQAEQGDGRLWDALRRMRSEGWTVAVHNDYRQNGQPMTFWLFTNEANGTFVKGEGPTDLAAVADALAALAQPPRQSEDGGIAELLKLIDTPLEFHGEQPTDEQLKWYRLGLNAMRCRVRAHFGMGTPAPTAKGEEGGT
jgi:hypothetical protein